MRMRAYSCDHCGQIGTLEGMNTLTSIFQSPYRNIGAKHFCNPCKEKFIQLMKDFTTGDLKKEEEKEEKEEVSDEPTGSCENSMCRKYLYNGENFCDDFCESMDEHQN
jgi:hypothetical protein